MQNLREHLLETLSFFEAYSVERIILDMNEEVLIQYPQFTKESLVDLLVQLEDEGIVKKECREREEFWKKKYPARTFWQRVKFFLKIV
jgi:hypothetical protein